MNERMYYSQEASERAQRERLGIAVFSLLLGVGISALLALIFAPRRGDEVRRELGKQVESIVNQGRETADHVAGEMRESAQKFSNDVGKHLQSAGR